MNAKTLLLIVVIAIVTAVIITFAQQLILGKTNVAITSAVTAITVIMFLRPKKKRVGPTA